MHHVHFLDHFTSRLFGLHFWRKYKALTGQLLFRGIFVSSSHLKTSHEAYQLSQENMSAIQDKPLTSRFESFVIYTFFFYLKMTQQCGIYFRFSRQFSQSNVLNPADHVSSDWQFTDHGQIWATFANRAIFLLKSRVTHNPSTTLPF